MYKAKFTLSDNDEPFEGWTDGSLWNGWAIEMIVHLLSQLYNKGE